MLNFHECAVKINHKWVWPKPDLVKREKTRYPPSFVWLWQLSLHSSKIAKWLTVIHCVFCTYCNQLFSHAPCWWGGGSKQNRNFAPIFSLISCEWKVCMFHMREIRKLSFCSTVACYCSAWQMMMGIGEARSDCFPLSPSSASYSPFFPYPSLPSHWALLQKALIGSGFDRVPIWLQQQVGRQPD